MAASPQTPKVPFNRVSMDIEEDQPVAMSGRACKSDRRPTTYRMAFGMVAVAAALLGAAVLVKQRKTATPKTVERASHTIQAVAKKFQQCGGATHHGSTCCQKGCACVIKTAYYSMCATPSQTGECSLDAAQSEPRLAKIRAKLAKTKIQKAAKKAAEAKKKVAPVKDQLKKAQAPLAMLRENGNKARKENEEAHAALHKAEKLAAEAADIADDWAEQYKWVKKHLEHFEQAEDLNKMGKCKTINGQCGGQIPANEACCVIGCVCHWKNKYYGQCRAPKGAVNCQEGPWRQEEGEVRDNATRLHKLVTSTGEKKEATAKALSEAKERATKARSAAIKAGTKRALAEKHERLVKKSLEKAQDAYKKAKKGAEHAVHNVKYAAAMVTIWKKVAEGDSCSDLSADDAEAMAVASASEGEDDDLDLGDDDDEGLGDDDDDDDLDLDSSHADSTESDSSPSLDSSDDEDDLDLGDDDDLKLGDDLELGDDDDLELGDDDDSGDDDDGDDDGDDKVPEKPKREKIHEGTVIEAKKEAFEDGADTEEIALKL